ncbi:MAG: hypothetical protein V3T14_08890 [Myxococcota bacterium]
MVSALVLPSGWYSGSLAPTVRLVQSNSMFQSLRGTPSISAITQIGSSADTRSTKSISPVSPSLAIASRIPVAIPSTRLAIPRIARGVNRLFTSDRYEWCSGGSMLRSMRAGRSTPWADPTVRRGAFRYSEGCREISVMSACRVIAQKGRPDGGSTG